MRAVPISRLSNGSSGSAGSPAEQQHSHVAGRFTVVAIVFLLCFGEATRAGTVGDDCLFSDAIGGSETADCHADPLHIAGLEPIVFAIKAIGVSASQVKLVGCAQASFAVSMTRLSARPFEYRIVYPVVSGYAASDYIGPITHELGHVLQLEDAGGIAALRQKMAQSSERIELGADFLAGVLFRQYMHNLDRGQFQRSLDLLGDYRSDIPDKHGTPEDRLSAFRYGFYFSMSSKTLKDAMAEFESDLFGSIKSSARPLQ